ncbi:hypothetical protein ACIBG0_41805 [Nocardia sp. NPDC050630]|uniref:hypothetical protein n=1 Tax=Nocardia sp. NPDC050630 TaxID=3364321 RepID=UPI0037ACE829
MHPAAPIKLLQLRPHHTKAAESAAQLTGTSRHVTVTDNSAVFAMGRPPLWTTAALAKLTEIYGDHSDTVKSFRQVVERLTAICAEPGSANSQAAEQR